MTEARPGHWLTALCGLVLTGLLFGAQAVLAEAVTPLAVKYISNSPNINETYFVRLIEQALSINAGQLGPYTLDYRTEALTTQRKLHLLVEGERVNVSWLPLDAKPGPRAGLIRIPLPLLKGLLGYRIGVIRASQPDLLAQVKSLEDLRHFRIGQGRNWADNAVYRHNGLEVVEALNMNTLFPMLAGGRYDLLPLGVTEVADDYLQVPGHTFPLIADRHLLLHYHFPVFFYVSRSAPALAQRLQAGLEQMIKSGAFDRIFNEFYAARLNDLQLTRRRLIHLPHPYFDASTDGIDPGLWYLTPPAAH